MIKGVKFVKKLVLCQEGYFKVTWTIDKSDHLKRWLLWSWDWISYIISPFVWPVNSILSVLFRWWYMPVASVYLISNILRVKGWKPLKAWNFNAFDKNFENKTNCCHIKFLDWVNLCMNLIFFFLQHKFKLSLMNDWAVLSGEVKCWLLLLVLNG